MMEGAKVEERDERVPRDRIRTGRDREKNGGGFFMSLLSRSAGVPAT